jgi:hypothetical protein
VTDPLSDPAFEPAENERSRDYQDVGEAARQLGGRPPDGLPGEGGAGANIHPIEESEEVAAAVDDEAPVPELAETAPPSETPSVPTSEPPSEPPRVPPSLRTTQPPSGAPPEAPAEPPSEPAAQPPAGQGEEPSSSRSTRSE